MDKQLLPTFFSTNQLIVSPNVCSESFAKRQQTLLERHTFKPFRQSRAKWLRPQQKLAIIYAFPLVFNEIALNPIDSPSHFSKLSMLDCPIDFVAATTLKWGGGKRKQRCPRPKNPL